MNDSRPPQLHRRHLLGGAAVLGAVPLLTACGADEGTPAEVTASSPDEPRSTPADDPSNGPAPSGDGLVAAADVPVGGGVVLGEQEIVVTQPTEGEFKAFSAICTHQGCVVQGVSAGVIVCTCHGSQFSVEDGSVVSGPAKSPLEGFDVTVEGGQIVES